MKVKEYLVGRILNLETELKKLQNEKAGTTYGLQKLQEEVIKLNEKIEQYEIEREHIKQIITCNICSDRDLYIAHYENDNETLLSILGIKPEDYLGDAEPCENTSYPKCWDCKYEDESGTTEPCAHCFNDDKFEPKEVTPDAETKD